VVNDRRRGLGKGLGALIPTTPTDILSERTRTDAAAVQAPPTDSVSRETAPGAVATMAPPPTVPALGALPIDQSPPAPPLATVPAPASSPESDLPPGLAPVPGASFAESPQAQIRPNAHQPRDVFDEEAMAELIQSIREVGLLQPIVVRRLPVPEGEHRFELIMGERRWRASQEAGLSAIPAIVRDTSDDRMLLDALLENLHRAELNPLEEAAAYDQLLQDFGCTHEELADRIGRSRPHVSNCLRLLKLPSAIQRRVAAGVLSAGHARALLSLTSVEDQEALALRIVQEGMSVRTVEEIVAIGRWDASSLSSPMSFSAEDYLDLEDKPRKKSVRSGSRLSPALEDIASQLSEKFETRVKVDLGQRRGKIIVEFASMEDLNRIAKTILAE
jgi:ParB family transcriptional regulator, chromosome partitioning protein